MTKVISLSNTAYEEIKALKTEDESFSDVVVKLVHTVRRRPLLDFFGKWPGDAKEIIGIKRMLERDRKRFKMREVAF